MPFDVQFYRTGEVWKVISVQYGNEVDLGEWSQTEPAEGGPAEPAPAAEPEAEGGASGDRDPAAGPEALP